MADIAAIVLAGGRSTRMGRDKAALMLGGRTLLQWTLDAAAEVASSIVLVTARGRNLPPLTTRSTLVILSDEREDAGPLAGLLVGVTAVRTDATLVLACDQPFVQPALLRLLGARAQEGSAVVPFANGELQPLCSAVRLEAFDAVRTAFEHGARAASILADLHGAIRLERREWSRADAGGLSFVGVNTPDEFVRAEAIAARLAADES